MEALRFPICELFSGVSLTNVLRKISRRLGDSEDERLRVQKYYSEFFDNLCNLEPKKSSGEIYALIVGAESPRVILSLLYKNDMQRFAAGDCHAADEGFLKIQCCDWAEVLAMPVIFANPELDGSFTVAMIEHLAAEILIKMSYLGIELHDRKAYLQKMFQTAILRRKGGCETLQIRPNNPWLLLRLHEDQFLKVGLENFGRLKKWGELELSYDDLS